MKKTLAAIAAGALLVAGQAAAQAEAAPRVGDRLGAAAGDSSEIAGVPVIGIIAAAGVIAAAAVIISGDDDDDSDSD